MKKLLANQDGTSVIETALLAPILGGLVVGTIDLAMGYSERLQLEQAAHRSIERVMQQRTASSDYSAELKAEAATAAGVSQTNVTVNQWLECNAVVQDADVEFCPNDTDIYARYVEVVITDTYTPFIGTLFPGTNNDGTYPLTGTAGIRIQ